MATPHLPVVGAASSDYGSELDYNSSSKKKPVSDYGSDFDHEEESLIAELLDNIARNSPINGSTERTIVYASVENGNTVGPAVIQHTSAVVRIADPSVNVEISSRLRTPPVEIEYHSNSRSSWSGIFSPRSKVTR